MTGTFIASTPKASMHALAYQGIMAAECYPQIRDMLRHRFGDDYVLLFAEPIHNKAEGIVDWYTPVQGSVQHLSELPSQEQEKVRTRLHSMGNDIRHYAEELKQSPDALKLTRGNILELILNYPDDNSLYVVGQQPVFVCWGFGPGTPGVDAQNLCRLSRITPGTEAKVQETNAAPSPEIPLKDSISNKRRFSTWWLLPLLLMLLLFLLLFSGFGSMPALSGITLLHFPSWPFAGQADILQRLKDENTELMLRRDALREKARSYADSCVPAQPSIQIPPRTTINPPAAEPSSIKQDLIIPENVGNLNFIQGRWRCDTGLENIRTHEPVAFEFSFDEHGRGQGIVHEKNDVCTGDASATLQDGMLHITLGPQKCQRSQTFYEGLHILCRNASGHVTMCKGTNKDGTTWDAYFKKSR